MTETHSLGDWEKDYKKVYYEGFDDFDVIDWKYEEVKDYIKSLLLAQKEGFRREIEEIMSDPQVKAGDADPWGILKDLLTKLDTNGI